MEHAGNIVGNVYDKYGTRNPIARALMRGFLGAVTELYQGVAPESVLEVGCGEGVLAHHLITSEHRPKRFSACDLELSQLAPNLDPAIEFHEASAYELPHADSSFDLVLCCEVLEHLEEPDRAFAELARVARGAVLVSTPWEPLWRGLNMARGKYLSDLGNTPGHIQHFSKHGLKRLAERHLVLTARRDPVPWTMLLGTPRPRAAVVS